MLACSSYSLKRCQIFKPTNQWNLNIVVSLYIILFLFTPNYSWQFWCPECQKKSLCVWKIIQCGTLLSIPQTSQLSLKTDVMLTIQYIKWPLWTSANYQPLVLSLRCFYMQKFFRFISILLFSFTSRKRFTKLIEGFFDISLQSQVFVLKHPISPVRLVIVLESGLKEKIYNLVYRLLVLLKSLYDSIDQNQTVQTKTVFIFTKKAADNSGQTFLQAVTKLLGMSRRTWSVFCLNQPSI